MQTSATPDRHAPQLQPVRSVVSPLLPVLLTLAVAALVLNLLLARWFPARPDSSFAVAFSDVTAESGLRFSRHAGRGPAPSTLAGAVVVLDFNSDGAPDLFFVNGSAWPGEESLDKRAPRGHALFRNDGRGRFADVTALAGLNVEMQGMGATVADFDADGRPDLFVTGVGMNRLFRNRGGGRFEDVTESAGLAGDENCWSTGAAWLDLNDDGWLDLVVLHYARWPREVGLAEAFTIADLGRSYGAPAGFSSSFPSVYRNIAGRNFVPVAGAAGLRDVDPATGRPVAYPLALVPLDANEDGRGDLLVTYHAHPPALFLRQPDGSFARLAAASEQRQEGAAALLAAGAPPGRHATADPHARLVLQLATEPAGDDFARLRPRLAFVASDFDHDGTVEVFSGEGVAEPQVNRFPQGRDFARRPLVLREQAGRWTAAPGARLEVGAVTARGVAAADFDGDGDTDVVIAQHAGSPILLRNDQRQDWPWLRVRLVATRGHPEAWGARVEVHTPRRVLRRTLLPALGYMAQSEGVLDFGLGDDARVRRVVIRWPSGQVQEVPPPALNRTVVVREP